MGSAGFILGGLLSGAGQGLAQEIQDRRAMALQQLRGQQAAESDARQAAAQADRDETKYRNDRSLLSLGSTLKIAEGTAASGNRITETKVKGDVDYRLQGQRIAGDRALATLRGQIDQRNDAASQRLRSELDGGQVESVQQTADGRFFIIKKDGSQTVTPYVGAKPNERVSIREGGGDDDNPIGARANRGGRGAAPAAAPTPAQRPQQKAPAATASTGGNTATGANGRPVLSQGEYQNAINGAIRKINAGEPGWRGLTQTEIRRKLEDIYAAAGYDLPPVQ